VQLLWIAISGGMQLHDGGVKFRGELGNAGVVISAGGHHDVLGEIPLISGVNQVVIAASCQ
jgi:outer membrane usher protein FimD/PapC